MIVLQWLLIASLFICPSYAKFKLKWKELNDDCASNAGCFLLKKCISTTSITTLFEYKGDEDVKDEECPFSLQVKYLNTEKSLNYLQIMKTMPSKKVEMYYGDQPIVSCDELDGKIVIKKIVPDESQGAVDLFPKLEIAPYEDVSYFDDGIAVCAFTMKGMKQPEKIPLKKFSFHFDGENYEYITDAFTEIFDHKKTKARCDPDKIRDESPKNAFQLKPVRYKANSTINCTHYKSDLGTPYDYHLYIVQEEQEPDIPPVRVHNLECKLNSLSGEWDYTYNNGTDDIPLSDQFIAYCAVEINKTCEKPTKPEEKLEFKDASDGTEPTLNCPNSKWFINGVYHTEVKGVCKSNFHNIPVFSIALKDETDVEITNGTELIQWKCFDKYNCTIKSNLDISDCDKAASDCSNVIQTDELKCDKPENFDLIIYSENLRNDTQHSKFTCNQTSGNYEDKSSPPISIPEHSRVMCRKKKDAMTDPFTLAETIGMYGGGVLLAVALAVCIPVGVYCCILKRKRILRKVVKTTNAWNKMSTAMKVDEAKKMFATEVSLLDGLKLLDIILEAESEEPELWDIVLPFLKRFHAVAYSHAPDLEKKFNRYCYLRARRIIDKHGWLSKTPVTPKNYSGFIRTCAVHLLSRARRNDIDAQKMVLEGFRVLQFQVVEQYPHCGLLLAVVLQQRVGVSTLQMDLYRRVEKKEFENLLKEENYLPQFGSEKHQLKFAMGAADVVERTDIAQEIFSVNGNVSLARKYVEGMLYTTSGNNVLSFVYDLYEPVVPKTNEPKEIAKAKQTNENLKKVFMEMLVPSREALDELVTAWIFNRRFRDAKNLEKKFNEYYKEIEEAFAKFSGNMKDKSTKVQKESRKSKKSEKKDGKEKKKDEKEEAKEKEDAAINETSKAISKKESEVERSYSARGLEESGKEPRPQSAYVKAKIVYQQYIDYMDLEKGSIIDWIEGKIQTEEPKIAKKESDPMPYSKRDKSLIVDEESIFEWDADVDDLIFEGAYKPWDSAKFSAVFAECFYRDWSVPRITACPYSEAEQKKLRAILNECLSEKILNGELIRIPPLDIVDVFEKAKNIFKSEPAFIEDVPAGITVVGDIHGQLFDLARILNVNAKDGKAGYECGRFLFLGDFIDRGPQILECILTLFILKILYPDRFYILRGNHEVAAIYYKHGTLDEIYARFEDLKENKDDPKKTTAEGIWFKLTETFNYMSYCAVIGGKIFCAHGGISPGTMNRHELRLIRKPCGDVSEDTLLADMQWNDPTRATEGFYHNEGRGNATFYGPAILKKALDELDCVGLIRAHQSLKNGYSRVFPNCLSIFSATNVDKKNNPASVVQISEDFKHTIVLLKRDSIYLEMMNEERNNMKQEMTKNNEDEQTKREVKRNRNVREPEDEPVGEPD